MNPADLTLAEAGRALRDKRLSSIALVGAHLDRIAARDPSLRAFVALDAAGARDAAERADRAFAEGRDLGPLHGIPFAVKDLIDVKGLPTRCGSRSMPDRPAPGDAPAVARLRDGGAVPLGKLATYEFAMTGPAFDGPGRPAVNPWKVERITGGSSSGSAVAVAGGLVRIALGTDTGGSVRSPAAFCGVVGLKPRLGLVPTAGVFPLSPTLDHVGLIAATVADATLMLGVLAPDAGAVTGRGIAGLRLGYARRWFADDSATDPALRARVDAAISDLNRAGATVQPVDLPDYAGAEAAGAVILHTEALKIHLPRLQQDFEGYGRQARQGLMAGLGLDANDLAAAHRVAADVRAGIDRVLEHVDAIVTATTLAPAPAVPDGKPERAVWTPMRTLPFNMSGHPAISIPAGYVEGLPVGLQIIAQSEAMICRIGAAFEAMTGHSRRPSPFA